MLLRLSYPPETKAEAMSKKRCCLRFLFFTLEGCDLNLPKIAALQFLYESLSKTNVLTYISEQKTKPRKEQHDYDNQKHQNRENA